MEATVRLYSVKRNELNDFLREFYNDNSSYMNLTEWEKKYRNPIELVDIIGTFIDNNDKYAINMWVSLDKGLFLNVTDENADKIIRYIYERYPWWFLMSSKTFTFAGYTHSIVVQNFIHTSYHVS